MILRSVVLNLCTLQTAKNPSQPHLISDDRATEDGESPEGMSREAREQDLEAFRDYIESSAAAADAASPPAARPPAAAPGPAAAAPAAAVPAAVAANRHAFAHDHEWYSPECAWPLLSPNRSRTPVIIPPLRRDPSTLRGPSNTAPRANKAARPLQPRSVVPKIAKVVVAPPAPSQQRRKTKHADQFPEWMYDGVIVS